MTAIPRAGSRAEAELALYLKVHKVQPPHREYRFHKTRKWRFDFAWPGVRFAVEVEGITFDHGRHQRKEGFEKDLEKYEAAMLDGWTVYRCSPRMIKEGSAISAILIMLDTMC